MEKSFLYPTTFRMMTYFLVSHVHTRRGYRSFCQSYVSENRICLDATNLESMLLFIDIVQAECSASTSENNS